MWHSLVPIGGTRGRLTGATLGGVSGHTRSAHTGRTSLADEHIASTLPLTHMHWQLAAASNDVVAARKASAKPTKRFIGIPSKILSLIKTAIGVPNRERARATPRRVRRWTD